MTDASASDTDRIAVGKCPNCGYVSGDDLDYRFPCQSECQNCGEKLTNTTVADADTVRTLRKEGSA